MRRKPRRLKRMLGVAVVLVALYFFGCWWLAYGYLHPTRRQSRLPENFRDVDLATAAGPDPMFVSDNLADADAVCILVHGYGGDREYWSEFAHQLLTHHIASVIPAMPGQDASPDPTVGFGAKEAAVVVNAIDWARKANPKAPITLIGVSLGGAASWIASAERPNDVSAVITEGAYSRFAPTMRRFLSRALPLGPTILAPMVWMAQRMSGLKINDINPVVEAEKWKGRPGLVIQAEHDHLISADQAEELSKATGCPLWVVPNSLHAGCFHESPAEYLSRVLAVVDSTETANKR